MRSQLPSLYRSLAKGGSATGYDAIAMAATLNFLSMPLPSVQKRNAFADLIEPLWGHLGEDTRQDITSRLSGHDHLPEAVSRLIDMSDVATRTPCKDDSGAAACPDEIPAVSISAMGILADRQAEKGTPKRVAKSASDARETLRALVSAPAKPRAAHVSIIRIAQSRDRNALRDYLAENLSLPLAECDALLDPDNLPELSGALKALGLSTADAMTVLIFVDQAIATNMATFAIAKNHYEKLSPAVAPSRFSSSGRPRLPAPRLQPSSADLLTPNRVTCERRPAFGRRSDNQNRRLESRQ